MPQTLYEYGGSGSIMHVAVANGFPPQTYSPLVQPLTSRYRVISLPPRPLWTDPPPPESVKSWRSLADDLLAGLHQYVLTDVIAIGHSFGGVGSLIAATVEPSRFRGLVLLDPTLFTPSRLRLVAIARRFGLMARYPLVQGALRRRANFASVDEAYAYWRSKRLFSNWSDETLHLYAESMTHPSPNGSGVELTWSPQWEAHYYSLFMTETWRYIRKLPKSLPVLVMRGSDSDTFLAPAAEALCAALPQAEYVAIAGHGHLFPQSAPDQTRAAIEGWLAHHNL
jgi:pimeloyl-ACP methyl ester carboxylesterase